MRFGDSKNSGLGHGGIFEGGYSARTIRKRFYTDKKLRTLLPLPLEDNSSFLVQLRNLAEADESVREFWEDILRNWAYCIAAIASTLSPQLIVLGGEMPAAGENGVRFMREEIRKILPFPIEIKTTVLGRKAGLAGAAYLVWDSDRACMVIGKNNEK